MKKRIWLIIIIILAIVSLLVVDTYALFETNASSENDFDVGQWSILLNDYDVALTSTITLSDFQYSANQHTAPGYLAPGRSAYFDIEIDASGTEVSVTYTLSIDSSQIEEYPNMVFSIKNMDTNQEIVSNEYSGVTLVGDNNRVINLRIFLNWQNNSNYDESDTSLIGGDLEFVIGANFEQYLGE